VSLEELKNIKKEALEEIKKAQNLEELNNIYKKYLGRKEGKLTKVLRSLKELSEKKRAEVGKRANKLKDLLAEEFKEKEREFQKEVETKKELDVTVPGKEKKVGHLHPLTNLTQKAEKVFKQLGFSVVEGPEVETEYYNFDALNIPEDHPARDLWDTFWLKDVDENLLLRTHTSPVQVRYMEENNPPIRIIVPGRCFRNERTDSSHDIQFYQIEGLMVGENINASHFKGIIQKFFDNFFGKDVKTRIRPSYFPFTEPSFEIDIECLVCNGEGCSTCGRTGWLEVVPGGMVHPEVLKAAGYNPDRWQGFAFGMGLDRIAMMKHKIDDIRLFYKNDLRFLEQF